jgi:hypothetical protein
MFTSGLARTAGATAPGNCLNAVNDPSATAGFSVVVWGGCSTAEANQQYRVSEDGQIKDEARGQCLEAEPCVAPCMLPSSWGASFLAVFLAAGTLYLAGGAVYAVKLQGKSYAGDGLTGMVPHAAFFMRLDGLVRDGVVFSVAEARKAASDAGASSVTSFDYETIGEEAKAAGQPPGSGGAAGTDDDDDDSDIVE